MVEKESGREARRPRADAERNRLRILETAKAIFAEKGAAATMDEIARAAGIGSGTLYRHFPTRDDLIDAVYEAEFGQLIRAGEALSARLPPVEALREWLYVFIDYIAAKQVLIASITEGGAAFGHHSADRLIAAFTPLVAAAEGSGRIRLGLDALDLLRAIASVAGNSANPDWRGASRRLVDVLMAGLALAPPDRA